MKLGLTASSMAHAAILAFAMVSLPSPEEFDTANFESLPVEVFSVEEVTNLRQGETTAPETPDPLPAPVAEPVEEPTPGPPKQEEVAALPPEPLPPESEPESEPIAEPEPLAEPDPAPESSPETEPETVDAAVSLPLARPKNIPKRPKRTETATTRPKEDTSFKTDSIAALLNKEEPRNTRRSDGVGAGAQTASLGARTGQQSGMSQSELDFLRSQISRCWSPPVGVVDPGDLIVRVQINLNRDGSLADASILEFKASPSGKASADSAMRAVRRCQPYRLPTDKYTAWQTVNIRFDPRDMLN